MSRRRRKRCTLQNVNTWTVRNIIEWTAQDLQRRGIDSARLDAEVLLAHALKVDRLHLYLDLDRPLSEQERAAFRDLLACRRQRQPVAYLTGTREFWSLQFAVSDQVLVPRPDTEVVVEEVLTCLPPPAAKPLRLVDVGTGSGCIALALAHERPEVRVAAIDIEPGAAQVAAENCRRLGLTGQVTVAMGDLLGPIAGPVDAVISNPPYIRSRDLDGLEPEVARWEPQQALDGGPDGLDVYRRLVTSAAEVVRTEGWLVLEIGHDQGQQLTELLPPYWRLERIRQDYGGLPRVVVAQRNGTPFVPPSS
jgi:release factor glutamine methyltransferase